MVGEPVKGRTGSGVLTALPADDGQVVAVRCPIQALLLLPEPLKLHRQLALLNFVVRELLEVARKPERGAHPDEPLGGVVLVPPDRVAVVHRKLVVEVVISLAHREERCVE